MSEVIHAGDEGSGNDDRGLDLIHRQLSRKTVPAIAAKLRASAVKSPDGSSMEQVLASWDFERMAGAI